MTRCEMCVVSAIIDSETFSEIVWHYCEDDLHRFIGVVILYGLVLWDLMQALPASTYHGTYADRSMVDPDILVFNDSYTSRDQFQVANGRRRWGLIVWDNSLPRTWILNGYWIFVELSAGDLYIRNEFPFVLVKYHSEFDLTVTKYVLVQIGERQVICVAHVTRLCR